MTFITAPSEHCTALTFPIIEWGGRGSTGLGNILRKKNIFSASLKQVVQLCTTLADNGLCFSMSVKIQDVFAFGLESRKPHILLQETS